MCRLTGLKHSEKVILDVGDPRFPAPLRKNKQSVTIRTPNGIKEGKRPTPRFKTTYFIWSVPGVKKQNSVSGSEVQWKWSKYFFASENNSQDFPDDSKRSESERATSDPSEWEEKISLPRELDLKLFFFSYWNAWLLRALTVSGWKGSRFDPVTNEGERKRRETKSNQSCWGNSCYLHVVSYQPWCGAGRPDGRPWTPPPPPDTTATLFTQISSGKRERRKRRRIGQNKGRRNENPRQRYLELHPPSLLPPPGGAAAYQGFVRLRVNAKHGKCSQSKTKPKKTDSRAGTFNWMGLSFQHWRVKSVWNQHISLKWCPLKTILWLDTFMHWS